MPWSAFNLKHGSHAMTTSACFPSRLAYSLLDHSCNRNCVRAVLNAPFLRDFFSCWSTFCALSVSSSQREAGALLRSRSTFLINTPGCASTTWSLQPSDWVPLGMPLNTADASSALCRVGCCLSHLKDGHRINYTDCITWNGTQWLCIFF